MADRDLIFQKIAAAMLWDYSSVYYVNSVTSEYQRFSTDPQNLGLQLEEHGADLFADMAQRGQERILAEDLPGFLENIRRERLMDQVRAGAIEGFCFRLIVDGIPRYHSMRLIRGLTPGDRFFILGVKDIDDQVKQEEMTRQLEQEREIYNQIAESLAAHYDTIYYVDIETDHYMEFSSSDKYKALGIPVWGEDFFTESRKNIRRVVHPDDIERVTAALYKEQVLKNLTDKSVFTMTYSLYLGETPMDCRMSQFWAKDHKHIILGIEDISEEVRREQELRRSEEEMITFSQIAESLAGHFDTIFYVDLKTDHFVEFSHDNMYRALEVPSSGGNFFEESNRNLRRLIHPEDQELLVPLFKKENILNSLRSSRNITVQYRILDSSGQYIYLQLTAMLTKDRTHLMYCTENIDEEKRAELALAETQEKVITYSQIAESLASHYNTIYYVSVRTNHYMEFSSNDLYKDLGIPVEGEDFFTESRKNIQMVIHPEDKDMVLDIMSRDKMVEILGNKSLYTLEYRLMLGGEYRYTRLSIMWARDREHFIIGVDNVDAEVRKELRTTTYTQIACSLANRYDSIYYVDTETGEYSLYVASKRYRTLDLKDEGKNFFADCARDIITVVWPEDQQLLLEAISEANLLSKLNSEEGFSLTYRLNMDGKPVYVNLRGLWADDMRHVILGVSNVDAQVRHENEQMAAIRNATELAMRDELTGVRNMNAYQELERSVQEDMDRGSKIPFAIVICDLNNLKYINDTHGHKAGDAALRSACQLICNIYDHSPVFRIGGDEFVAILMERDYKDKEALLDKLRRAALDNQQKGTGPVVASGMGIYDPDNDRKISEVFQRADSQMYDNKKKLKALAGQV